MRLRAGAALRIAGLRSLMVEAALPQHMDILSPTRGWRHDVDDGTCCRWSPTTSPYGAFQLFAVIQDARRARLCDGDVWRCAPCAGGFAVSFLLLSSFFWHGSASSFLCVLFLYGPLLRRCQYAREKPRDVRRRMRRRRRHTRAARAPRRARAAVIR